MNTASLEKKLIAALSNDVESSTVAALLEEANAAIAETEAKVNRVAMDPISCPDPNKARGMLEAADLDLKRLRSLLPKLEERFIQLQNDEEMAHWSAAYAATKIKRDNASERLKRIQILFAEIINLFQEAEAVDREVSVVNGSAPPGEFRRLHGVELTARGLQSFSREQPPLASNLRLPDYNRSDRLAFPSPTIPAAVLIAAPPTYTHWTPTVSAPSTSMPTPSHFGTGEWWRDNEQIKNASRAESERIRTYYDDQARAREKREKEEELRRRA